MEPIKSFEQFIGDAYKSTPANEEVKFGGETPDSIIPTSARKKLWEFVHECMESGVVYETDEQDDHTLERFMNEAGDMMASQTIKALKQNRALIAIAAKANISEDADEVETKAQVQEYMKGRLDEIHGKMLEGFSKGIQNAKEDNQGIAALVAAEMMKEEK